MRPYNILDFGAVGDGRANDAPAIQKAIEACHAAGGGRVIVPGGKLYLISQINLKSRVDLHLAPGSTLTVQAQGQAWYPDRCVIHAWQQEHISITGLGAIDGRCKEWCANTDPPIFKKRPDLARPHLIHPRDCNNVVIRDITVRDAPFWTITPAGCRNVSIRGVTILNDLRMPNCDGIDPDNCAGVRISNCHIETGDDCICVKSSAYHGAPAGCADVAVKGCNLVSASCAIKIGSETAGDIRNAVFDACVITGTNRGLGIQSRDGGSIENIRFSNMIVETRLQEGAWWGKAEPIHVSAFPRATDGKTGSVRNIHFNNIACKGENGLFFAGNASAPLAGILLDNVRITIDKCTGIPGGFYDTRPGAGRGQYVSVNSGVHCEHIQDITLRNVTVSWGANRPPYYGPALYARHVQELRKENFRGQAAHPDKYPDEDLS